MDGFNQPPTYPPAPTVEDEPTSIFGGGNAHKAPAADQDTTNAPKDPPTTSDGADARDGNNPGTPLNDGAAAPTANPDEPRTPDNGAPSAAPAEPVDRVQIVLKDQSGNQIAFGVKSNTRMEKVQNAYAEKTGRPVASLRFYFEGNRVTADDNVTTLEMENEDIIEVMTEQIGGGGGSDPAPPKLDKYVAKYFSDESLEEVAFVVNKVEVDGKWVKEMEFVVGPDVKVKDFKDAWAKRAGCSVDSVVFRFTGTKEGPGLPFYTEDETFGDLDLQPDDKVYVSALADEPINLVRPRKSIAVKEE
ncbi:hypothetical protein D6D21_06886 [Aureobasidium pullulans]|uniref:Ubiquitin-like domain-containing protein n=1 Tax=Aureobasidium pullulans TaxID=5580 RepID=A0AB74ISC0_AURPU|nr:hypothetical protein D6D21_06886 [Aureobasidium pullulans]